MHLTASVGSIYALMLIAIRGLRVRLAEAEGVVGDEIGNILKRPNTSEYTSLGLLHISTYYPIQRHKQDERY